MLGRVHCHGFMKMSVDTALIRFASQVTGRWKRAGSHHVCKANPTPPSVAMVIQLPSRDLQSEDY